MRGIKWARQKIQRAFVLDFAVQIGKNDGNVAAKFPNDLATGAAGRCKHICVGDDTDSVEFAFAFGNGFENGDTFGADGEPITRVFNIAAGKDAPRPGAHGGTDAKTGERCMCVFAGIASHGDELFVSKHGRIMHRNEI